MNNISGYDETTPVLIVGGSLVGLSASLFLSWHGVSSLLVERHAGISPHPRAFNFNMRTMEFYRQVGTEGAIRQKAPAHFQNSSILMAESLAGRELRSFTEDTTSSDLSPVAGCIIGQDALEPVLKARAIELGGDVRFATELVSYEQDAEGVSAVIRDTVSGVERSVRAQYLLAADGNRSSIRQGLGVKTHGPGVLSHQLSVLFAADAEGPLRGRRIAVCFINNPAVRKGASLVFARNGQGLALFLPYFPEQGEKEEDFTGERGIEQVRGAIGIPDLPVEIVNVNSWEVAAWAAGCFQQDRIFLVGDSAHVTPAAGAFGANMGIADAYNLAWKLGLVLKGSADSALLATYTEERQPVVRYTTEQAFYMFSHFSASPSAKQYASSILPYNSVAFGYRYHSAALPTDAEDQGWYEDPYQPTGRPGTHAAHVVLERNGEQCSTLDLFGKHFVLFTGEEGASWATAAPGIAELLGVSVDVYQIGGNRGDFVDPAGRFLAAYGIEPGGAVLVRPDSFIGWRAEKSSDRPASELECGLARVLGR